MATPKYTLGLDIGIASVGAALITDSNIMALHVRTFEKAETPKEGDSLNKVRREARGGRRRLRRRTYRLSRLRKLFVGQGLLNTAEPAELLSNIKTPWELRVEGLDRVLNQKEWAIVLYHLVKRRGFQSNRKSEIKVDEKAGKMLDGVKTNQSLMAEKGYRTIGELAQKDESFSLNKRNKGGAYTHTFARADIELELRKLFQIQRELGNKYAGEAFEEKVHKWLMARRPTLSGADLIAMVGKCSFEQEEYRIPKACYRFERFTWLQKLNNLKVVYSGESRSLTDQEKQLLIELPFIQSKLTYKQVRTKLDLPEEARFNLLSYRLHKDKSKDPEAIVLFEAKAYNQIRKQYEKAGLKTLWQRDLLNPDRLDTIGYALTCFKDDKEITDFLIDKGIEGEIIESLLDISFEKFGHLSQKAIKNILPYLEQGQRYDEASLSAGYHHSQIHHCKKSKYLPAPDREIFRNPVVYRATNQARKLVNAIIKQYGPPEAIHIELARDLSNPYAERKKIEKAQGEYRVEKEKLADEFESLFGVKPKGLDLQKFRLYREQDGQCAYSLKAMDLNRICEPGYVEVDHALPYSRSFDNSQNNKVLVLKKENQDKANRTPFEYLGGDETNHRWRKYEAFILSNPKIRQAKRNRLLRKHFGRDESEEFKARNLSDTRYICKAFKNLLESQLTWHSDAGDNPKCVVVAGQLTSLLRARWGLLKDRSQGDLHHALDAAVVAACSRSFVQRMAKYSKYGELEAVRGRFIDEETGEILDVEKFKKSESIDKYFPQPWMNFRHELLGRLSSNPAQALEGFYDDSECVSLKPIRVSRMPTRRGLGVAHQDTIRSVGKNNILLEKGLSSVKTPLHKLKLKDLENIAGADNPRNEALIGAIRARLEAFNGDGAKAFSPDQPPLLKPSKDMSKAPVVRSVKLVATQKSGLPVRKGIANNGDMLRVDIFSKSKKYYAVPIYASDVVKNALPNKAATANKPEQDWPELDDSYQFCFSLYPNDWVKVVDKKQTREGYFSGLDRATAAISLWAHDRNKALGKDGLIRSIGIKSALSLEKYHVDLLGNLYKVEAEERKGFGKSFCPKEPEDGVA